MINRFKEWCFEHLYIVILCGFLAFISIVIILLSLLIQNDDSVRILRYARVTNISNESIMIKYNVIGLLGGGYSEQEIPVDYPSKYEIGDILAIETNRANKFLAISENSLYNVYATVTGVGYKGITVTYTDNRYGEEEEKVKKISVDETSQCEVGDIVTIIINASDEFVTVSKDGKVIWTNWLIF